MKLTLMDNHWVPTNVHGITPYSNGDDVASNILKSIKQLLPVRLRMTPQEVKYLVHSGPNGQSIVWEIDE